MGFAGVGAISLRWVYKRSKDRAWDCGHSKMQKIVEQHRLYKAVNVPRGDMFYVFLQARGRQEIWRCRYSSMTVNQGSAWLL